MLLNPSLWDERKEASEYVEKILSGEKQLMFKLDSKSEKWLEALKDLSIKGYSTQAYYAAP